MSNSHHGNKRKGSSLNSCLIVLLAALILVGPAASIPSAKSKSNLGSNYWKPTAGLTWNYELINTITNTSTDSIDVWDIDLFDNTAKTIQGLQANGAKVICYFSAGSYENWRPDKSQFKKADLGSNLDGWPGERWLDIRSANVRKIMKARLDLAVQKNCDGVDPDNVDGYGNNNGLGLTPADSTNYIKFLAKAAHSRNLSIGLKNAGDIVSSVIDDMQWSVNEQCTKCQECDLYAPFIKQGKPVFHVEYPKGDSISNMKNVSAATKKKYCSDNDAKGFSTILKNINLDSWIEAC